MVQHNGEARGRAVRAVRAFVSAVDAEREEAQRLEADARDAVTWAILRSGCTAQQIAELSGVSGLVVVQLLDDVEARTAALAAENARAEEYAQSVRAALRALVVERHAREGRGVMTRLSQVTGLSRTSLHKWVS